MCSQLSVPHESCWYFFIFHFMCACTQLQGKVEENERELLHRIIKSYMTSFRFVKCKICFTSKLLKCIINYIYIFKRVLLCHYVVILLLLLSLLLLDDDDINWPHILHVFFLSPSNCELVSFFCCTFISPWESFFSAFVSKKYLIGDDAEQLQL